MDYCLIKGYFMLGGARGGGGTGTIGVKERGPVPTPLVFRTCYGPPYDFCDCRYIALVILIKAPTEVCNCYGPPYDTLLIGFRVY